MGGEWLVGSTVLEQGKWYHAALACDSKSRRLFLSGKMESGKAGLALNPSNDALGIGKNVSQDTYFFPGIIDEVKIWSVALTSEQLMESMEGRSGPKMVGPSGKLGLTWGKIRH
jgi:hypothetical protein